MDTLPCSVRQSWKARSDPRPETTGDDKPVSETEEALTKKRRAAQHPDRPGERCNAPVGTWAPIVDHGRCEAKRDCVVVCPNDVFEIRRIDDDDFRPLSPLAKLRVLAHRRQTSYTPNVDACRACGLCVVACPEGAITLVRKAPATDSSSPTAI
jgi:NAD-dependent dihydropyrimidine dehydrogenase PreA subunit